ncbi:hypothetical protein P9112_013063 [Eukaryota sp. TZLM1-RC]
MLIANFDEIHFVINIDNEKTLGFSGDTEIRYANVVLGGQAFTMVVKLIGGTLGKVDTPFLIFVDPSSSYPIRGVTNNIEGAAYRSSPSGFMSRLVLSRYLSDISLWKRDRYGRKRSIL